MTEPADVRPRAGPDGPLRAGVVGLGPIGREILRVLAAKPWAEVVAAVDVDPELTGRDAGEVAGLEDTLDVAVTSSLETDVDVVAHATVSSLVKAASQLEPLLRDGVSVASTCEELAYPLTPDPARRLEAAAREGRATVLGTGINPGFLLDALPAVLTVACQDVERIDALRVVDAAERRRPLQEKVGAGLSPEAWERRRDEGRIRHVGLPESARLLASALGWDDVEIGEELIEPVRAEDRVVTEHVEVEAGQAAGVRQVVTGARGGEDVLRLELQMYVGAARPRDAVEIRGTPPISMVIEGGVQGDRGTAAVVVNMLPAVARAAPGLTTMAELPLHAAP